MSTLFIGIGTMGAPMARCYSSKHRVTLYDVGPTAAELGTELDLPVLTSLASIPTDVDTVIVMVPNSRIVESILLGKDALLDQLPSGSLVIDMSSSEPASTRVLAAKAAERGISLVDAPVSGGRQKAEDGKLTVIAGGDPSALKRAREHIEPMAGVIHEVGAAGNGHAAKALNNLLSATNIIAATEVLTIATKAGIDPTTMTEVINASTGRSQATEVKFPNHILPGNFDSGFGMDLMIKDLGIARTLANQEGLETPLTALAQAIAQEARTEITRQHPDHTELARFYEQRSGVSLHP